jgi:hypothetical protein
MQTQNAVFTAFVAVTDDTGMHHNFTPGDPIPAWALPLVGDHVIEFTEEVPSLTDDDFDPPGHHEGSQLLVPPPPSGPGSGRREWAAFAAQCAVPVSTIMSRRDIIDVLTRKGFVRE